MTESKKEALAQFHRKNILQAAQTLFAQKSFAGTTMDEIATLSQYSKATIYVYFKSKEEILQHLTYSSMQKLYEHLHKAITENTSFFECFKSLCYELVSYYQREPLYFELSQKTINSDDVSKETPQAVKDTGNAVRMINNDIAFFLQNGIDAGIVHSNLKLLPATFWLWGSITGIIRLAFQKEMYILRAMEMTKIEFLDYNFKLILQGLLKPEIENLYDKTKCTCQPSDAGILMQDI